MIRQRWWVAALFCFIVHSLWAQHESPYCRHAGGHQKRGGGGLARTTAGSDNYDVKFYHLNLEADNLSAFVRGSVSIKAQAVASGVAEIVLGLSSALEVDSVYIDGVKTTYTHASDVLTIDAGAEYDDGDFFTLTVYYKGNGSGTSFFSGISNGVAPTGERVTWTLSEPENAIDWFPCKQVLEDKADSAYIFITVPENLKAGSNGLLTSVVDLPENRHRFEWKTRYPIAYYLISMAIAEYDEYNTTAIVEGKEIPVQNYIYRNPDVLDLYKPLLDLTADMITETSALFGPYPFADEKYGHAMAPLGGGMEHQTMSTMDGFSFTLVAHELGHQWFGDHVTCASWQDIWINEGFARYAEYMMIEKLISKETADSWMALNYDDVLTLPFGSVHVPSASAQDEFRIFDFRLTYNKGGALVHMLRNIVNDDAVFFGAMKAFQEQYSHSVASADDFREVLEAQTGMSFGAFFDEWYYGEGHPMYKITWNYDSDTLYIRQLQTPSNAKVSLFTTPVDYRITQSSGSSIMRLQPSASTELFKIYMEEPVTGVAFDPENWMLKKVTSFARDRNLKYSTVTSGELELSARIDVYPNPAHGNITVANVGEERYEVSILNAWGQSVRHEEVSGTASFDTSGLPSGIYLVKVKTRRENAVVRVSVVE